MEDQQDLADQVASNNCKLQLLEKTHEIEQLEKDRLKRRIVDIEEKAKNIREKNSSLATECHIEMMFRREENERSELLSSMKKGASQLGLTSIVEVLENYEGKRPLFNYLM